mgnify:CR=1 FL=1
MNFKKYINHLINFCFISYLIFFYSVNNLSADEINWIEVAGTNSEIQFIDANSIKYNNKGFLSVITKYAEVNPDDQTIINTNSYLMAVDCDSRLFSKLPINGDIKQVKNWQKPINDKLIKKTILISCTY